MLNLAVSALLTGTSTARTIDFDTKVGNLSEWGNIYQSIFSADKNLVYVTSSVGRPPVNSSDLIAVDADTLKVVKVTQPPTQEPIDAPKLNVTQPYAIYGIDLDSKNGLIWVTNTRQGTAAYYKEDGLEIGNQYPIDTDGHTREVYVNPDDQKAYVSDAMGGIIYVYDAENKDKYQKIINMTEETGSNFTSAMGFTSDDSTNTLWTVSMNEPLAASIDLSSNEVKTYDLGDVESASDVAWDSKRSVLYVASQKSNDTVVLDPKSNKVVKTIGDIPGALSVVYEPTYDLVYVASRTGKFVAVIDASDYSVIDHLDVPTPNEISLGPDGSVFVTDHSSEAGFYKFTPKKNGSSSSNSTSSSGVAAPSSAPTGSTEAPIANGANVLKYSIGAGIAGAAAMMI